VLFPVYLGMALLAQLCLRLGFASRLLISSAREFIADAEAVRLTQHPAALVSALQRIHGNSALPGLPFEQDAMMIDGMAAGRLATHPPIMERIQAIVAITGQMALDVRPRRDTRGPTSLRPGGFEPESLVAENLPALEQAAAVGEVARGGGLRAFFARDDDRLVLGLRRNIALAMLAAFLAGMAIHRGNIAGVLGQVGNGYTLLANLASLKEQMRACQGFNVEALRGRLPASDSCDGVMPGFASQREPAGFNERAPGTQTLPTRGVATPAPADKPKAKPKPEAKPEAKPGRQAAPHPTDLELSYAMPVHEAWQRLAGGSIAPFLRARQCGITLDSRVSAVADQSVTWTVTSEDVAQLRFTATLSANSPGTTRISLDIADLEETVPISDKSKPKLPPYPVAMRPALKPPLRPYFVEAVNAMLEGRAFQASRVVPTPTLDAGANDTANLCASQRSRLATGARFSIHDRLGQP
jgi:hypothetical protein